MRSRNIFPTTLALVLSLLAVNVASADTRTLAVKPGYERTIKNKLTTDGCHMNTLGNIMMTKGVLRAFGLGEEKIAAAEMSWLGK